MARVAAGLHDGDIHATTAHVFSRESGETRADPASLIVRIDADDVDHAHSFMERVQGNRDEPDRPPICQGDEHVPFLVVQADRTA